MKKCPECGGPITAEWDAERRLLSFQGEHFQFGFIEAAFIDLLWRANQSLVPHERLESKLWGCLDVDAHTGLTVLKYKLSKKIPGHFPVTIWNVPNWQGAGGGYWLER